MRYTDIQQVNDRLNHGSYLTALEFTPPLLDKRGKIIRMVKCLCKCGTVKVFRVKSVTNGETYSCGCRRASKIFKRCPNANKLIMAAYRRMIKRCYIKTNTSYSRYGGRGVVVCKEWRDDYYSFEKWALSNGWAVGLALDKDILGNGKIYSPETCKWVTLKENNQCKSNSRRFIFNGELLTLSAICEKLGVKRCTIDSRLRSGIKFEDAIKAPIKYKRNGSAKREKQAISVSKKIINNE